MEQVRVDTFLQLVRGNKGIFQSKIYCKMSAADRVGRVFLALSTGHRTAPIKRLHFFIFADSFVNSQEWTLSRGVPDIRLGIVGSLSSGKSALVHRYLTGSYMQEESPEGGRFKKEVVVDGHSYLLLIRDEGGPPELQVSESFRLRIGFPASCVNWDDLRLVCDQTDTAIRLSSGGHGMGGLAPRSSSANYPVFFSA